MEGCKELEWRLEREWRGDFQTSWWKQDLEGVPWQHCLHMCWAVERWRGLLGGSCGASWGTIHVGFIFIWLGIVRLPRTPFSDWHTWNISSDDYTLWEDFLNYMTNKALDHGLDSSTILDGLADSRWLPNIFHLTGWQSSLPSWILQDARYPSKSLGVGIWYL